MVSRRRRGVVVVVVAAAGAVAVAVAAVAAACERLNGAHEYCMLLSDSVGPLFELKLKPLPIDMPQLT